MTMHEKIEQMFNEMNDMLHNEKSKIYKNYWAEFSVHYRAFNRHRISMLEEVERIEKLLEAERRILGMEEPDPKIIEQMKKRERESLEEQLDRILKLKGDID